MSLKSGLDGRIGCIEVLQIKNENLLPILDSIISHEKHCVYYTPNLYFSIRSRMMNDTISEFQIEAFGSILIEPADHYRGCSEYNGHWFFVVGQELNETVFIKTNQRKTFVFHKPEEITSDGKILLRVIEDDTFSFWIYHYVDDEFFLREKYDTYCKK
jgi:hypothetical protein